MSSYYTEFDKAISSYGLFRESPRSKIPVILCVVFTFTHLLYFNIAGSLITGILGWCYPGNVKALESADYFEKTQWIAYWIIFTFLQIPEFFSDVILYYFPGYFLFKALLIVYMVLPPLKGARSIYVYILRPLLIHKKKLL
ncbi:TB2/DP1, HVA22 family-domain-containing protein [Phycomyces nitens]|nr:TB2/DP1, HVA22 family-domain-containing protein [Phycomyces nitens]KAI9020019.1 TB2/DP1, HVA22 family-domain-containing protein [Phycomyces nitens]